MGKGKSMKGFRQGAQIARLRIAIWFAALIALSVPAWAVHPYQEWADEFGIDLNVSYDGVRIMKMKDVEIKAKEYRAPGKMLTEVNMGNMSTGILLREDLNKTYMLMHSMGMYREESLDEGIMAASNGMEFSKIEEVGPENVSGFPSTKFKTRFKDNEGKGAGHIWITDSGIPIKMDMIYSSRGEKGQRIMMEFTELNVRDQDPDVFELPDELKPMGFGNLGGLGGMFGNPEQAAGKADETEPQPANDDLSARQQACLAEAAKAAEEAEQKSKTRKAFGKLMGAVGRTAARLGTNDIARTAADIYAVNASASDISEAAKDLGITEEEVERCREP